MTISPLPILIDARSPEDADGEATLFPRPGHVAMTKVQVVGPGQIKARARKVFSLKDPETPFYEGLKAMRAAFENSDISAFQQAWEKARPGFPFPGGSGVRVRNWEAARWLYSTLMSNAVQSVRHVIWFPFDAETWSAVGEEGDRLAAPALYCPSEKTAVLFMLFMDYLRVCLHSRCRKLYVPKTTTQKCCCPNHSNSLRVKRCNSPENKARREAKPAHMKKAARV